MSNETPPCRPASYPDMMKLIHLMSYGIILVLLIELFYKFNMFIGL